MLRKSIVFAVSGMLVSAGLALAQAPSKQSTQAQGSRDISLVPGTYVAADTPCGQASNATILRFDGRRMMGGRYCSLVEKSSEPMIYDAKECPGEEPVPKHTYQLKSATEFYGRHKDVFRLCEQASLPPGWRDKASEIPKRKKSKAKDAEVAAKPGAAAAQSLSDMVSSFRMQVTRCWTIPHGATGTVTVRIQLNRDGSLAGEPRLMSTPSTQFGPALASQAVTALKKCQPFSLPPTLYEDWKDMIVDFAPTEREESYLDKLKKAEEERQQRVAAIQAAQQKQRLENIQAGLSRVKAELGTILETEEGRAYVVPLLQVYRQRELCNGVYEYVGGKVLGRSIDGNVGVILVELLAVAVRDSNTFEAGSGMARLCGYPAGRLQPGGILRMEVKGVFRKYDTGWRFERILE